jgi:hypothetical protein
MGGCASSHGGNHVNCLAHQDYQKPIVIHPEEIQQKKTEFHEHYHVLLDRISVYEKGVNCSVTLREEFIF